jgi:hypothetical protein
VSILKIATGTYTSAQRGYNRERTTGNDAACNAETVMQKRGLTSSVHTLVTYGLNDLTISLRVLASAPQMQCAVILAPSLVCTLHVVYMLDQVGAAALEDTAGLQKHSVQGRATHISTSSSLIASSISENSFPPGGINRR